MWSVTWWLSWCFSDQYVNPQAPNASSNGLIRRTSYGGLAILKQWLTCLPAGWNIAHRTRRCNWQCSELRVVSSRISTGGHCVSNKCWPQKSHDWKLRATMRVCKRLRLTFHACSQRSEHYNERWKVPQSMSACFNILQVFALLWLCSLKALCSLLAQIRVVTGAMNRLKSFKEKAMEDETQVSFMSIAQTTCCRTVLHSSFAFRASPGKGEGMLRCHWNISGTWGATQTSFGGLGQSTLGSKEDQISWHWPTRVTRVKRVGSKCWF